MNGTLFIRRLALCVIVVLTSGAVSAAEPKKAVAPKLPVYKLAVGQELVYRTETEPAKEKPEKKADANELKITTTWHLYVVCRSKAGNWRLIGQRVMSWRREKTEEVEELSVDDVALISFEIDPQGKITWKGAVSFGLDPGDLFPRLPENMAVARKGWNVTDAVADTEHSYQLAAASDPAARNWVFRETRSSPTALISHPGRSLEFHFDAARGLVDRVEESDTDKPDAGVTVTKLVSAAPTQEKWLAHLIADYDRYIAADAAAGKLQTRAQKDPEATLKLWSEAEAILKQARQEVEVSFIQETLDRQIARQARNPAAVVERAKNYAEVLTQPPVDWEADDLAGTRHSLAQYRGKVVVLDFWYRGCGWCIRAMPQIKQVAAHFEGQPVAVLGMNIDGNVEDANFVVDKLKLEYPNLRAEQIPQKYKVRGYPTLIVIDQEGKVHDIHFGYSQTLKDELIATIEAMLK